MPSKAKVVEASFDDRLPIDVPKLWDPEGLEGHNKMAVVRSNARLEDVFNGTEQDLPKLMASVRWSVFQMSYGDYAKAAGMSANGYRPTEEDRSEEQMPHRIKYTKLLAYWRKHGISPGIREQMLDLLHDGREDDTHTFWSRVGYELGHGKVERYFPTFYNKLWQHRKKGVVQKGIIFMEMLDTMYPPPGGKADPEDIVRYQLRHEQGERAWRNAKIHQLQERGVEEALSTLLTAIEWDIARYQGESMTIASMGKYYGLSPKKAEELIQCELVSWEIIEDLAQELLDPETFAVVRTAWEADESRENLRQSFGKICRAALGNSEITPADIGRGLDIRPPEERIAGYEAVDRQERYRPDALVRAVMFDNRATPLVSVDAMLRILAQESDVSFSALSTVFGEERARFFRRSGAGLHGEGLEMRLQRERAGVSMTQLAEHFIDGKKTPKKIREMDLLLQKLERQEGKGDPVTTFTAVKRVLKQISKTNTADALDRFDHLWDIPDELYAWDNMQEMAGNLCKIHGTSRGVREEMEAEGLWIREDLVRDMRSGTYVPCLPYVSAMSRNAGKQTMSKEVERDWYARYPEYLLHDAKHPIDNVLARMLTTLICSKEAGTAKTFFAERYMGAVPTHAATVLYQFQRNRKWPDWEYIEATLAAGGVSKKDPSYAAAEVLWDTYGDTKQAASAAIAVIQRKKEVDVHPMHVLGFTQDELDSVKAKHAPKNKRTNRNMDSVNEFL